MNIEMLMSPECVQMIKRRVDTTHCELLTEHQIMAVFRAALWVQMQVEDSLFISLQRDYDCIQTTKITDPV